MTRILRTWRSARWKRSILDAWSQHHARSGRSLEVLAAALVRYACVQGRDVLVHAAIDELYDWRSLSTRLATAKDAGGTPTLRVDVQPKRQAIRALARVVYRQQILPADLQDATAIYEALAGTDEQDLEPVDHGYLVDALTILGRRADALQYLKRYENGLRTLDAYTFLLANLLNPYSGGVAHETQWLQQVSAALTAHALEPISLKPGEDEPFCRLACDSGHFVADGPLVSILMPVYESNPATDVAIGSILSQSWKNLELIVVDDASPASARARLRKWQGRDKRLRIIYNEENRGAYFARNAAYELARGEFITVADKDDWHHPRKIELQVLDLVGHPDKLANMSSWSRVSGNLCFLVRYAPIQMAHPSQPSLFFRRKPVKEALGYWDSVRKGADGEYKLRMEKVFGIKIKPINRIPLALSLIGGENLSSRDFGLGYEHPDRSIYKQTYAHWHQRHADTANLDTANLALPKEPARRPFPAPMTFLPTIRTVPGFDVVLVLDLAADAAESTLLQTEIISGVESGMRIAVLHVPDLLRLPRKPRAPSKWLNDLILDEKVARLSQTDRTDTDILLIANPRTLHYRPELPCGIVAGKIFILASHGPLDPISGAYVPATVADNIRSMFNSDAIWIPTEKRIRSVLRSTLRRRALSSHDWVGLQQLQQQAKVGQPDKAAIRGWHLSKFLRNG